MSHTKSPWILRGNQIVKRDFADRKDTVIANIETADEEDKANAKLICLAPEMYDALTKIEKIFRSSRASNEQRFEALLYAMGVRKRARWHKR